MKTVRAVYGNGFFRPLSPVELPEGSVVEFEPRLLAREVPNETLELRKLPAAPEGWTPKLQEFDPTEELEVRWRNLPHWQQKGATYFGTFRLGDALPAHVVQSLRAERLAWLKQHPSRVSPHDLRAFQALFSEKIETYLAAGYGGCCLRESEIATVVENALLFFDQERYSLDRYVLMPNHVHLLVLPWPGHDLPAILHSWKSYTANQINRLLRRQGLLWQHESFDHLVRNEEELEHYRRYIDANPVHARLAPGTYRLGCGRGLRISPEDQ